MKFDKNKILTIVTADQAKVGQKGWFSVLPHYFQEIMSGSQPSVLSSIDSDSPSPFTMEGGYAWPLFYPAPEPTYAERQAEWVKEHNIQVGTKVRITRAFSDGEDGIAQPWNESMGTTVGKVGVVERLLSFQTGEEHTKGIRVDFGDCKWWYPYFTLEVIKEPTYRPFHDDELNDIVGKVVVQNHTGNAMLIIKIADSETGKVVSLGGSQKRNAQQLLDGWAFKDGHPCGVKEEM